MVKRLELTNAEEETGGWSYRHGRFGLGQQSNLTVANRATSDHEAFFVPHASGRMGNR